MNHRRWRSDAAIAMRAERIRSGYTPLMRLPLEWAPEVDLYVKDESASASGNLKHRLARYLIETALTEGTLSPDTVLVEASSGSTAIAEAFFARTLGLGMIAVVPSTTSPSKIATLQTAGVQVLVDEAPTMTAVARQWGDRPGHVYLDQFGRAAHASEWRSENTLAGEILRQMTAERHPVPAWIVAGVGTGGTTASLGRHMRWIGAGAQICAAEPEFSAHYEAWADGDRTRTSRPSRIEGIGPPFVSPSFVPEVIDAMVQVPDVWSIAGMRLLGEVIGRSVGPSSGTNFCGALHQISEMVARGESGSVVTLVCDSGERYLDTYRDREWLRGNDLWASSVNERVRDWFTAGHADVSWTSRLGVMAGRE